MSARRTALAAVAAALTMVGVAGCGTDHGQADALVACHKFASANGGGLTPTALTAKLSLAVHWAGMASKSSARWDTLQSSLAQFVAASTENPVPAETKSTLVTARTVIDSSCEIAARGY
jgi:hypothetical protein